MSKFTLIVGKSPWREKKDKDFGIIISPSKEIDTRII